MAFLHSLPAPQSLEINDSNVAEKWSEWKEMWEHNSVPSKVNKEEVDVQVAAFLTAIGPEARNLSACYASQVFHWQDILPDVLHSVHSLLCTATNKTPHERIFGFSRRSSAGASIHTWLATPGPVHIKGQVRTSKMDPFVDEVELLQAKPHYAHVRYPDGRETTLATKHLAPKGHMEVVETPPATEHYPEEAENFPLDTHASVTPDAGQNHYLRSNLNLNLDLNLHLYIMRKLHLIIAPNEFVVL